MADEAQAQTPASDAPAGAEKPVIDMEAVTLDQLDELLGGKGTAELPMVVTGGEQAGKTPPAKVEEPPKAKVEEPPPAAAVEETRTPEEIETAQTAARERVQAEGGDDAAQDAAAEEAGQPGFTAPVVEEPPPAKVEEEEKGDRFRYSDPTDRAINALYRARKGTAQEITWAEAEKLVKGDTPAAAAPPAVVEVDHEKIVGDLETEVTDIKRQLDEAGANEGVFDAAISKLTQVLAEKTADLKLAQRDQRIATAQAEAENRRQAQASTEARAKAKSSALEQYPEAGDDTTPLGAAVAKRIAEMKNPNHPDHSILYADSAPLTIVRDVAAELGIQAKPKKAKAPPATPPPATPPAAPPKSKVLPPSGAKTSVTAAQPVEDAKKHLEHLKGDSATLEELDAVFEPGGQQKTLQAVVGG